jgi:hypothetical protein
LPTDKEKLAMSFEQPSNIGAAASPLDQYGPGQGGRFILEPPATRTLEQPPPPPALAKPDTVSAADAQLAAMVNDPAFRTRLLAGDAAARREFFAAHEAKDSGDKLDQLLDQSAEFPLFETVAPGQLPIRAQVEVVNDMRSLGISDGSIRQAFDGTPVSKAEFAAVKLWKDTAMADRDFTARWLGGDLKAQREMTLANIVLTNGHTEAGARF